MAQVRLEHVGKVYPGNVRAVDDFNLTINDGEFMVMVGPSGCGKSTTLRMVAGLEEISEGTITIGDRVVNDVLPKDRDIAMVFQNYALYPDKTVYENMAFCLKMRNFMPTTSNADAGFLGSLRSWWKNRQLKRAEIDRRVREAADILGIQDLLNRRPKALSGGQRQRVAVGRCIVRNPAVFLFDEPLSNLDAKMRVQMRTEISRLHNRLGTTMIYVTHDQTEAMTMGDRIVVMKDGLIQQVATPADLYDSPKNIFVAGFIGTPPMNFFDARVVKVNDKLQIKEESFALDVPAAWRAKLEPYIDKKVIFGLRPEHVGSPSAESIENAPTIPAVVEVIEPMGSETYLYMKTGATGFIARVDPHRSCKVGDQLNLAVIMANGRVFDVDSTNSIV
ncbi:MAG: ATP-binding cassette domain-containing protein [Lentisphaerae bacterium]|jgi:multiple sugar transport system ATP-binding protein|nr:ATP-binding cassette domain-containing protein [Lentisphaerota bacterium]